MKSKLFGELFVKMILFINQSKKCLYYLAYWFKPHNWTEIKVKFQHTAKNNGVIRIMEKELLNDIHNFNYKKKLLIIPILTLYTKLDFRATIKQFNKMYSKNLTMPNFVFYNGKTFSLPQYA